MGHNSREVWYAIGHNSRVVCNGPEWWPMVEMPPLRLAMLSVSHKSSFSSPITLSFLLGCDNRLHVSRNCPQHVTRYIFLIFGQRCASSIVWKCGIHFPIYKKSAPEKCIFNLGCSPFQSFTNLLFSIFATTFCKNTTKSSQTPSPSSSHHLWKGNKMTCSAGFHVHSRKLFFRMHNSFVVQKYKKRQNHHKH